MSRVSKHVDWCLKKWKEELRIGLKGGGYAIT